MTGTPSEPKYRVRFTRTFIRATKSINKHELQDALSDIVANPYHARGSELLKHDWAGFRGAKYSGSDRIIFRVCEECVRNRQQEMSTCCRIDEPGNMLVFAHFGDYHRSAGRRRIIAPKSVDLPAEPEET